MAQKDEGAKVSTKLESYSHYVLTQLIGIKGKSISDVLSFIVKQWISDHQDELRQDGIDVQKWLATRQKGG